MTYREFKQWLITRGRINAWTTPTPGPYSDNLLQIKNTWEQVIAKKNLDGLFGSSDLAKEFENDFLNWIAEVEQENLAYEERTLNDFTNWLKINPGKGNPDSPAWIKLINSLTINLEQEMEVLGKLVFEWNPNLGNIEQHFKILVEWVKYKGDSAPFGITHGEEKYFYYLIERKKELDQIKNQNNDLVTKLKGHETTIRNNRVAWEKYASEVKLRFQALKENKEQVNEQAKLLKAYYKEFGEIKLDEEQNDEEQEKKQQEINKTLEEFKESLQKGNLTEVWNLFFTFGSSIDQLKNLQVDTITSCQEQIKTKEQELIKVRNETTSSTASLREEITNLKEQLKSTQAKNNQLIKLEQQLDETKQKLTDQQTKSGELESQLTGLALGSSLLVKQVEDLTNQLSSSQLAEQSAKLEREIKENLLISKENELADSNNTISQQTTKLNAYQQIIRNSEENLKKAQDIIFTKTELVEKLEEETNNLTEQLEQTEEDLKQLEISFITSQTKINELETRIKELESDNANQLEIDNLKQQLVQAKNNHQQEKVNLTRQITQLQSELTNIKNRESQLSLKIQALTTQQEKVNEEIKTISWWTKIRTPFLIISGIGTIIFAIKLIKVNLKNNHD